MAGVSIAVMWLVAGLVLMLLEMVTPGVLLVWLGLAALGTGTVLQFVAMDFAMQVLVFTAFAAVTITLGLRLRRTRPASRLNTAESGLVGRAAIALEFHGRTGRVRLGDSDWSARLAPGAEPPVPHAELRVVGVDGTILIVGPA